MMRPCSRSASFAAALLFGGIPSIVSASDMSAVYVRLPLGLSGGGASVSAGPDASKYVSVEDLSIPNPSRRSLQTASPRDFHLIAGGKTYAPVVRKGLDAIDFSQATVVPPGGTLATTVTFLVPDSVTRADFEFTPHWFADDGHTVDFCCDYP